MLVEIGVVNTHSLFIILFLYKDRISYPLWMNHFFDEASHEEFCYFPFNCLMLVMSKSSKALLFGHSLWVYIQTMLDQFPGHPWHIRRFSREYISVSLKETDECEFLFLIQARANDGGLR
jgi:hypothetical protein